MAALVSGGVALEAASGAAPAGCASAGCAMGVKSPSSADLEPPPPPAPEPLKNFCRATGARAVSEACTASHYNPC